MKRILVWDIPTRLFHWLLGGGFLAAFAIIQLASDDSPVFAYHALIGLSLAMMVVLRLIWGVVGTRYARFGSFAFGPVALYCYFKGILAGAEKRYTGHNPGSAYAIYAMLAILLGLAATGIMMSTGGSKAAKSVHEVLSYAMIAVVGIHVLGVFIHTLRLRENITLSMIDGKKTGDAPQGILARRPIAAAIFVLAMGAWSVGLLRNYNAGTQSVTLPLFGTVLQLAEAENEAGGEAVKGTFGEAAKQSLRDDDD